MLEWARAGSGPRLARLIGHDDATREYAYAGTAATYTDAEPITNVSRPEIGRRPDDGHHGSGLRASCSSSETVPAGALR
jgi:hypothetical protein